MRESLLASSSRKGIREEKQKEKAGENERVLKTARFLTRKRGSASRREIPGETGRLYLRLISGGKGRTRRKHRGVPRQRDKPPRFCFVFAGQKIREKPANDVERSKGSNSHILKCCLDFGIEQKPENLGESVVLLQGHYSFRSTVHRSRRLS